MDAGLMALMTFVGILGGGAITAFWKKKAENYATKQDVAELTTITKKIEADISSDVWDRQKQWEMKREVIFDMSRKLSTVDDALISMHTTHKYYRNLAKSGELVDASFKAEAFTKASLNWGTAADTYDGALALMGIVCSPELYEALRQFIILTRTLVPEIQKLPQSYYDSAEEIARQLKEIRDLMRKELGVDPT
jgi:hypothetical protein